MLRVSTATECQFNTIIVPHIPCIRHYAASLTRNRADADDLLQDTLLRACLKLHLWRADTNMAGWLTVMMRRIFLTHYRRGARGKPEMVPIEDKDIAVDARQEKLIELREIQARWTALPKDHREVLRMVAIEGESYDEVAGRLRLPLGTLRSRLHRAREALRSAGFH